MKKYKYNKKWVLNEYLNNKATAALTVLQPIPVKNAAVHGKQLYMQSSVDEMHGLNAFLACATYLANGCPCILTDSLYSEAPYEVRLFLAEHELGHLELGHIKPNTPQLKWYETMKRFLPWTKERRYEYEADAHAASSVGAEMGIEALNWILDTIQVGLSSRLELKSRIKALESLK